MRKKKSKRKNEYKWLVAKVDGDGIYAEWELEGFPNCEGEFIHFIHKEKQIFLSKDNVIIKEL